VSISNRNLPREVSPGTPGLLDDGAMELVVTAVDEGCIRCRIIHGGLLRENKSVNLPETELALSSVSPEYREDVVKELTFAAENDAGNVEAAMELAEGAVERFPMSSMSHTILALAMARSGDPGLALGLLEAALELDPENEEALSTYAELSAR